MGGFAVDTKGFPEFDRYPNNTRIVITPSGLVVWPERVSFWGLIVRQSGIRAKRMYWPKAWLYYKFLEWLLRLVLLNHLFYIRH